MTMPNPVCKRGDVVLVLFPHSNLRTAKPRPSLVVQADNIQTGKEKLGFMKKSDQYHNPSARVAKCRHSKQDLENLS